MPFQDFREFLNALRNAGGLLELDRPVSPELEVAKAMRKSASVSGPALIFKNNGTTFGLVGGVYNTRAKSLIALQTTEKDALTGCCTECRLALRPLSWQMGRSMKTSLPAMQSILPNCQFANIALTMADVTSRLESLSARIPNGDSGHRALPL